HISLTLRSRRTPYPTRRSSVLLVHSGGWWLFAFVAIAAVLALHEYALMTRSLRPVTLAAYAGALLALLGAELGGLDWTVGGFLGSEVHTYELQSQVHLACGLFL